MSNWNVEEGLGLEFLIEKIMVVDKTLTKEEAKAQAIANEIARIEKAEKLYLKTQAEIDTIVSNQPKVVIPKNVKIGMLLGTYGYSDKHSHYVSGVLEGGKIILIESLTHRVPIKIQQSGEGNYENEYLYDVPRHLNEDNLEILRSGVAYKWNEKVQAYVIPYLSNKKDVRGTQMLHFDRCRYYYDFGF